MFLSQRHDEVYSINENNSAVYAGYITDENGATLTPGVLTSLTATLYDKAMDTIINNRNKMNVLNANGGTMDVNGNFELQLSRLDNPIVTVSVGVEEHILLLEWTWGTNRGGSKQVRILVTNLRRVP